MIKDIIRDITRDIVRDVSGNRAGSAFNPENLEDLLQFSLNGAPYYSESLLDRPVLRSLEPYGTYRAPRQGRCWLFDGSDDYCAMPAIIGNSIGGSFTFVMNVNASSLANSPTLVSVNSTSSLLIYISSAGQVGFGNGTGLIITPNSTAVAAENAHFAFVHDISDTGFVRYKIYKNGSLVSGATTSGTYLQPVANSLCNLFRRTSGAVYFAGKARDIRIYNVAKDATAIAAIYAGTDDTTGLLAHYPCNEESGTVGYDISGNANHLTLTNITQTTFHATDTGVTANRNNVHGYGWYRFAATDVPKSVNVSGFNDGFQYSLPLVVGVLYKCTIVVSAFTSGDLRPRIGSSGSPPSSFTSGTDGTGPDIAITGVGTYVGYCRFASGQLLNFAARSNNVVSVMTLSSIVLEAVEQTAPFIPKRLTTDLAADGNALTVTGKAPYPITVETPCLTGDGSAVHVNFGIALIPASADFELSFWYYHTTNDTNIRAVISQRGSSAPTGFCTIAANQGAAGAAVAGSLMFVAYNIMSSHTNGVMFVGSALTENTWHEITLTRSGNALTGTCQPVNGSLVSVSGTLSGNYFTGNQSSLLISQASPGHYADGRITDLRITTGGVTTYFPLQDGPGSSNTNRNVAYYKSDGTYGVISNAIVNGTVANIWANRCPYVEDHSIKYGGRLGAGGQFILGVPDTALCADGNSKTLLPGKFTNPYSRLNFNPYTAAELNSLNLETSYIVGQDRQSVSPVNTKFRRVGDDRFITLKQTATGATLAKLNTYVGNTLPALPLGKVFIIDSNGNYLVDSNGNYIIGDE